MTMKGFPVGQEMEVSYPNIPLPVMPLGSGRLKSIEFSDRVGRDHEFADAGSCRFAARCGHRR